MMEMSRTLLCYRVNILRMRTGGATLRSGLLGLPGLNPLTLSGRCMAVLRQAEDVGRWA